MLENVLSELQGEENIKDQTGCGDHKTEIRILKE